MDAQQIAMFRQRNVEHLLAASALQYPLYTLQQCRWLEPEALNDIGVKKFWSLLLSKIQTDNDDEAQAQAIQAALEAGIYQDALQWERELAYTPMPQAYAHEIARRAYLAELTGLAPQLTQAVISFDDKAARTIIEQMYTKSQRNGNSAPNTLEIAERFNEALDGGARSIDTFIPGVDNATGGLERQTLNIVAARPSMGKTALVWQIAQQDAHAGHRVLVASLEQSAISMWARAACPKVGVTWRDVRAGRVDADKIAQLKQESVKLAEQFGDRLRLIDTPQTTATLWQAVSEYRPDVIVADHLRKFQDEAQSEVKRQGMICARLKEMAKSFNAVVLLAAQLNRGVEMSQNKRPSLKDLRDSGEIEEEADVVLMLYRPDYYSDEGDKSMHSPTELWIRKFRDGPSNVLINLIYNKDELWFIPKP